VTSKDVSIERPFKERPLTLFLALLTLLLMVSAARGEEHRPATVILVVRHAEKEKAPAEDPPLTAAGRDRAEALSRLALSADIAAIYATPTRRTRQTVGPLAKKRGLETQPYEAKDYAGLAADIVGRFEGRTVLVCGHSNTLPGIVAALGGGTVEVRDEEFDHLFVVVVPAAGPARTIHLRYGPAG